MLDCARGLAAKAGTIFLGEIASAPKIGNLVKDVSEEIDTIGWNVYGKITKVIRSSSSTKSDLYFEYDAMGNRICKIVKPRGGHGILAQQAWTYTYYLRDASGNILANYTRDFDTPTTTYNESYTLTEDDHGLPKKPKQ